MTCTQASSGRRFCSAGQLKKNNVFLASSHRNRAGHGPHYSGRWEVGGSFLPQPPSAQQADNLDPGHEPSILFPGWGRGSISGAILAAKSPWQSLPLGEVEWPAGIQILHPGHTGFEKCESQHRRALSLLLQYGDPKAAA